MKLKYIVIAIENILFLNLLFLRFLEDFFLDKRRLQYK